jgi:S1-C subfamily serine protease
VKKPSPPDWPAVDENSRRSTLYVETTIQKRDDPTNRSVSHGTAFVHKLITGGAHALTAAHVVKAPAGDETAEYKVALSSRHAPLVRVQVVKRDLELDIALLLLPATSQWTALPIGESSVVPEGSELYTLGFPLKSELAGASGRLSSVQGEEAKWQTTLPTERGSSGGPVLDAQGKVVAVASGGIPLTRGMTYAIPIDYVVKLL